MTPYCTVLIPVYNGEAYLGAAIQSALAQDAPDVEVIVVDNASTDRSLAVAGAFTDPRLIIHPETGHVPIYANFNRALRYARSKYVVCLCADDQLAPDFVTVLGAALDSRPGLVMAACGRDIVDASGNRLRTELAAADSRVFDGSVALWEVSARENCIGEPSAVLARRDAIEALGGFNEALRHFGDLDLWCRLFTCGDLFFQAAPKVRIRIHPEQLTVRHVHSLGLMLREARHFMVSMGTWGRKVGWSRSKTIRAQARYVRFKLGTLVRRLAGIGPAKH
jgi:glycosyltransferase involved in cell wall biosynthesis